MSIAHDFSMEHSFLASNGDQVPLGGTERALHRIAVARNRQGVSVRSAARRLGISIDQVREQEEPTHDLLVSELQAWQRVLEVPINDLLLDCEAPLSAPVLTRARLLKVMKTVRAIKEATKCISIERMATMLEQQLIEMMPELKDVAPWHTVGQRRSHDELGRTAERVLPDSFFTDSAG
jgi:transcriptional regulator with XRE-family HTH domain